MKWFFLVSLLSLCQCGYNWGHQTRELPGGHKTVYVEMFENTTQQVGVEIQMVRALTQELLRSGFVIVTTKDSAEVIIKGQVLSVEVIGGGSDPTSFVAKDFSPAAKAERTAVDYSASFFSIYTVRISANLRAIRSRDKHLIWQTNVSGFNTFESARLKRQGERSSNVLYNEARKKQTIKLIAIDMMSNAYDRLTENF